MSTQTPYYQAYLSRRDEEVFPGLNGSFDFDAMTVTTWMGEDVLTPGLPYFRAGKGAIVVTRSSNPSGTTMQDLYVGNNSDVLLSEKQMEFRLDEDEQQYLTSILGRCATANEVMLYQTELFCTQNELGSDGVNPIFSVMGSTVKMDNSFRRIRGQGAIALVPGFGAQGGNFENIMPLAVKEGPLRGHVGVLSSSRDHNYPWMDKSGKGDPKKLESEMARAISNFRRLEHEAYAKADVDYPF